jgi:y4mF family transcriptional regulator
METDHIGLQLRQRRHELGLRQSDLAALADVSVQFLNALENGKATVQLDKVTAVAAVLGLRLTLEPVRNV